MQDANSLAPGLMIIHGNRLETLRELVVDWMRTHPLGPLENEVILVQSNGIAQWLQMALAADTDQGGSGIAAALDVQLPARFLWDSYRGVLGRDAVPEQSPLDKQPLLWRLMRLLPELLEQPEFVPLKRFLADDSDCRKRYQLAERLADLPANAVASTKRFFETAATADAERQDAEANRLFGLDCQSEAAKAVLAKFTVTR